MKLSEIPEKILADMVRDGCYTRNASLGDGEKDSKFLLVFAVPYGPEDGVTTLQEAFDSFHEFISESDWFERNIQVLTLENGIPQVQETCAEVWTCEGCGRLESACSADPCAAVVADREATI